MTDYSKFSNDNGRPNKCPWSSKQPALQCHARSMFFRFIWKARESDADEAHCELLDSLKM